MKRYEVIIFNGKWHTNNCDRTETIDGKIDDSKCR